MYKNVASQKIQLFAFDITSGAPKTGDAANITAYVSKDHGAVTVLGDTSATELDSTNAKGVYVFDLTQGETNGVELTFTAKSATANISITPRFISTTPNRFSDIVVDAAGLVDATAVKVGPSGAATAQTARDVGGNVDVASSTLATAANLATVAGYIDTEVAAIKTKTDFLPSATAGAAGGLFIAGSNAATTANITGNITGNLSGSVGSVTSNVGGNVTGSVGSVVGAVGSVTGLTASDVGAIKAKTDNLPASPASTSDVTTAAAALATSANLATLAGYVDTEVAAIKAKTDNLPAAPAAVSDIPTAASNADAVWDEAIAGHAVAGSTGEALANAGSAGTPPTAVAIADEVETRTIAAVTIVNGLAANVITAAATAPDFTTEIQAGLATASALSVVAGYVDTEVAAIKAKTDNLPSSPAAVSDIPTAALVADAVWDEAIAGHAGVGSTGEALSNAGASGTPPSVSDIADEVQTRTIAAVSLVNGLAANVITAAATAPDFTTEIQTGLATSAALATVSGYVDTEVAAIKAKTDNLPASPASTSDVTTAAAGLASAANLATLTGYVDTEVAAIKAKTDNLPASPASTSDITSAVAPLATSAALATVAGYVDTEVAAIKAKTDNLPASPAAVGDLATIASNVAAIKEYADNTVIRGTVDAGATLTTLTTSALTPAGTDIDQFKGRIIIFDNDTLTSGLQGQATDVTGNTAGPDPTFTFTALTTAPADGDSFSIT